jgi:hypothetical protein
MKELDGNPIRKEITGFVPITPHIMESNTLIEHQIFLSRALTNKMNRYIYLFPVSINFSGKIKKSHRPTDISLLSEKFWTNKLQSDWKT